MQPFTIQCTTCQRSLRVTSPEAIGQILACPKCGSMVMVEGPPGWSMDEAASMPSGTTPVLLSASTFVPPKPSRTPQPSATPPGISANVASTPASPKPTAWKDPPPHATPPGEALPKGVGSRSRDAASPVEKTSPTSTPDPIAQPILAASSSQPQVAEAVAHADAEPAVEQPPVEAWPRWFLPGAAATIALGLVIFILRLLLQSSDAPVNVAQTPPSQPMEAVVRLPSQPVV